MLKILIAIAGGAVLSGLLFHSMTLRSETEQRSDTSALRVSVTAEERAETAVQGEAHDVTQSRPLTRDALGRTPDSVTAQLQASMENEVTAVTTEAELETFLDRLERRARSQRMVSALEIAPGRRAIQSLAPVLGEKEALERQVAFLERMGKLSAELDGRELKVTRTRVDIEREISGTRGADRKRLVAEYVRSLPSFPEDEQQAARDYLHGLTQE